MLRKLKREFLIAKGEITIFEYIFWWICRVIMLTVYVESRTGGEEGHFRLEAAVNLALMFVLPELHLLPRGRFTLARLNYRAQTAACAMVIITCFGGCYMGLYSDTWYYDLSVHFIGGVVCVAAGVMLFRAILNGREKMSPVISSAVGFGISCFTSLAWECYEFFFDWFADDNTQHWSEIPFSPFMKLFPTDPARYPLYDSMTDLAAGLLGAIAGGLIARLYYEKKKKNI